MVDIANMSSSVLSIQVKYLAMLFLTASFFAIAAPLKGLSSLKLQQLRNEAKTVAEQVVSFRAWVSRTEGVWVERPAEESPDFLSERKTDAGTFFLKNPALATRELAEIVSNSNSRATFRVTSDNTRDPRNAPDEFEINAIQILKKDRRKMFAEAFEDGYYRYAQPIYITKDCLKCHGNPWDAPPEVIRKYLYKAFDYKEGMMRGIISVRLPDVSLLEMLKTLLLNVYSLGVFCIVLLINFLFMQYVVIRRLRQLSAVTEEIAAGDLQHSLPFSKTYRDEIDQIASAIDHLRMTLVSTAERLLKKNKMPLSDCDQA